MANLAALDADSNGISDITALSGLAELSRLALEFNQISDIGPLHALAGLTELYLYGNPVNDIAPLGGLTDLYALSLTGGRWTDISPLANLAGLTLLVLDEVRGLDLTLLSHFPLLMHLGLGFDQLTDADTAAISSLSNLETLALPGNQMRDLDFLSGLTQLTYLDVSGNQIAELDALTGLPNLTHLDLGANHVVSVADLVAAGNLAPGSFLGLFDDPLTPEGCESVSEMEDSGVFVYYDYDACSRMGDVFFADFRFTPDSGPAPLVVQFIDRSVEAGDPIERWHWDFGDGSISDNPCPVHEYSLPGTYTVTLEVETSSNETSEETKTGIITAGAAAPYVVSVVPDSGDVAGGKTVAVKGSNFYGDVGVTFDGLASTSVEIVDTTELRVVTPAHPSAGLVDVHVSAAGGSASLRDGFIYVAGTEVTGVVHHAVTQAGLGGVAVDLVDEVTLEVLASVDTLSDGSFRFTAPYTEGIGLRFSKLGYDSLALREVGVPGAVQIGLFPSVPAMPVGLRIEAGVQEVRLIWEANTEPDLAGYYVYREGTRLTDEVLRSTSYVDVPPESGLDYCVSAVDQQGNESVKSGRVNGQSGRITVTIPDVDVPFAPGVQTELRAPIRVSNAAGIDAAGGISIDLQYDSSLFESARVAPTGLTENRRFLASSGSLAGAQAAGRVRLSYVGASNALPLQGGGDLVDLYLLPRADAELGRFGEVRFNRVAFYDSEGLPLPVDYEDMAELSLNGGQLPGDVSADGFVDSGDAILLLRMAVALLAPEPWQREIGDMNGDGALDSADALLVQRVDAGLPRNPSNVASVEGGASVEGSFPAVKDASQHTQVRVGSSVVESGAAVRIPVEIECVHKLAAFELAVACPPPLQLDAAKPFELAEAANGFRTEANLESGRIRVAASTPNALDGVGGAVLFLRVEAPIGAQGDYSVRVNGAKLKGQFGQDIGLHSVIERTDGEVTVVPAATGEGEGEGEGEGGGGCSSGTLADQSGGPSGGSGGDALLFGLTGAALALAAAFRTSQSDCCRAAH